MVRVVVAARTNRGSARLPVIVSDYLIGYSLSGDGAATLPPDFVSSDTTDFLPWFYRGHEAMATVQRPRKKEIRC